MTVVELLKKNGFPPSETTHDVSVLRAEERLKLTFNEEFRKYLLTYGQLSIGATELTGVDTVSYLDVVGVTEDERQYNSLVPENFYVIESLGVDGIIIWQSTKGAIYQTIPEGQPEKIFDSLEMYLSAEVLKREEED